MNWILNPQCKKCRDEYMELKKKNEKLVEALEVLYADCEVIIRHLVYDTDLPHFDYANKILKEAKGE